MRATSIASCVRIAWRATFENAMFCALNRAVAQTSTWALTNVTIEYAQKIADLGVARAVIEDAALAKGVNCFGGNVTCSPVALAHKLPYSPLSALLKLT